MSSAALLPRRDFLAGAFVAALPAAAWGRIVEINSRGDHKDRVLSQFDWTRLQPGDVVEIAGGTYNGEVVVRAQGTADRPIVLRPRSNDSVRIEGTLVLERCRNVIVENLEVSRRIGIAIVLRRGSEFVTVRGCRAVDSALGIWIGEGAGGSNLVANNLVARNRKHGIAIDAINLTDLTRTTLRSNRVENNGYHGIELNGSYYIVEGNEVYRNGFDLGGTTGIHVYAADDKQATGCHNLIRYNVSAHNGDKKQYDGNGIQLDRWCDHNLVHHNLVFDNDGAGINIFHGDGNRVVNNTIYGNMLDVHGTHPAHIKGDLVIINDLDMRPRLTSVKVENNLIVTTVASACPIVLDRFSATVTQFRSNQVWRSTPGSLVKTRERGFGLEGLNAHAGSGGNAALPPLFVSEAPKGPGDFQLSARSPARGAGAPEDFTRDLAGQPISPSRPDRGALQFRSN